MTPVASFVSVIVAPGTIAPDESVTVPVMPPVSICAERGFAASTMKHRMLVVRSVRLTVPGIERKKKDEILLLSFRIVSLQKVQHGMLLILRSFAALW
jgi:hypothetical protein